MIVKNNGIKKELIKWHIYDTIAQLLNKKKSKNSKV